MTDIATFLIALAFAVLFFLGAQIPQSLALRRVNRKIERAKSI